MTDPYHLNLRHVRAVSAISAARRIVAAATQVGLSQPALTHGLARLERHIGARLFQRRTSGMVPTAGARLMAMRSDDLFAHLATAFRHLPASGRGFAAPETLMTMTQMRR